MKPARSVSLALSMFAVLGVGMACAPKEDVTPLIVVSPGAKERIVLMDRLRHHGSPRRLLPRVTVEEVDEADLPEAIDDDAGSEPANEDAADAGL